MVAANSTNMYNEAEVTIKSDGWRTSYKYFSQQTFTGAELRELQIEETSDLKDELQQELSDLL